MDISFLFIHKKKKKINISINNSVRQKERFFLSDSTDHPVLCDTKYVQLSYTWGPLLDTGSSKLLTLYKTLQIGFGIFIFLIIYYFFSPSPLLKQVNIFQISMYSCTLEICIKVLSLAIVCVQCIKKAN